jgi:Mor family transcriptional regulator
MFKGQQITFPMYLFDKKYIAEKIREEYDGSNGKELAKKYGYSERHIREIAKK